MFIEKYLNDIYINILYSNYEIGYLKSLDEDNFVCVYNLLKKYNFDYIEDIIINYIELFEIEYTYVDAALKEVYNILNNSMVKGIGNNMTIIDKIIELANKYQEIDNNIAIDE